MNCLPVPEHKILRLAGSGHPNADGVGRNGEQKLAIGTKSREPHFRLVAQRLSLWLAGLGIPDARCFVLRSCYHPTPIGAELGVSHVSIMFKSLHGRQGKTSLG